MRDQPVPPPARVENQWPGSAVTATLDAMTIDDVAAAVRAGYGLDLAKVSRIAAGTATGNFRAEHASGAVMVKVYRPGTGLEHERRVLAVTDAAYQAGLPVARLYRSKTGALLHEADGVAASVWQWCDSDIPPGPLSPAVAYETGSVLARLHTFLRRHDDGRWPVAQPHYRRHTLNQVRQRFTMLARHIETQSQQTRLDALNLDRIRRRLGELRLMPGLLESATPPQLALVHGDFVRPNLLVHKGRLSAVIDMRLKYDEPVRELGRLAFDVQTIAAGGNWLDVAEAALTGYQTEGGIVAPAAFYGCARLALLHSLCSTYPVEDLYLNPPPQHLRDDLNLYWANRVTAVTIMLDTLDHIDRMVTRITRTTITSNPVPAAEPADPRQWLPVVAAARAHLLDQITGNAGSAGVKALLLWGSGAAAATDALSDIDLIAVTDDTVEVSPATLVAQLAEPAPLLFSRTVTSNARNGGFYRGICAQVAGWPVWADIYLLPATAATIPADATVLFDHLGLPRDRRTFWQILDAGRADADGNPEDEPESADLLRLLINAKQHARTQKNPHATGSARLRSSPPQLAVVAGQPHDPAEHGIEALRRWEQWCNELAASGVPSQCCHTQVLRRTSKPPWHACESATTASW